MKSEVYLGLGANLGDREQYLKSAVGALGDCMEVKKVSRVYQTDPWGYESNEVYYNICICGHTELNPEELLNELQQIEKSLGRERKGEGYSDRTIDIDILFFGNLIHKSDRLQIPHPQIAHRNFVLAPLNDVGKNFIHPYLMKTVNELFVLSLDHSKANRVDGIQIHCN